MKDEDDIELVAGEARREERLSELERSLAGYSAGTLSPERLAELEERAAREPEIELALTAHRALSPDRKRRITSALKAVVDGELRQTGVASEVSISEDDVRGDRAEVRTLRARWPKWLMGVGVPVLAAAGFALVMLDGPGASIEPLGSYALEVRGTRATDRGAPVPHSASTSAVPSSEEARSVTFVQGQPPVFWLRPERRVAGPIAAFVFVSDGSDGLRLLPHELEHADSGALRVALPSFRELPPHGRLWLLVTRPEVARDAREALALVRSEAASGGGWRRWTIDFGADPSKTKAAPQPPP